VIDEHAIGERYRALAGELNERQRRLWAASEARAAGRGGIAAVARASGMAENTIRAGLRELEQGAEIGAGRVRRKGAGRRSVTASDPGLLDVLRELVEADTRGDPEQPLLWTSKSVRRLSHETVAKLLRKLGYSLQANRKTKEGRQHPDRDAQFRHINERVKAAIKASEPVISIDTKHRELIGEFKNGGREWAPKGQPVEVNTHDFPSQANGVAIPYGVYDLARNEGWVSVGGSSSASSATQRRARCRSPPTAAAATATAPACGRPNCSGWPTTLGFSSPSATSRPAPRSGTKSSTASGA
jgi:hypothetical protein